MTTMPSLVPYGVPIRMVMETGDRELMRSMLVVSDWIAQRADRNEDWAAAHEELRKAAE